MKPSLISLLLFIIVLFGCEQNTDEEPQIEVKEISSISVTASRSFLLEPDERILTDSDGGKYGVYLDQDGEGWIDKIKIEIKAPTNLNLKLFTTYRLIAKNELLLKEGELRDIIIQNEVTKNNQKYNLLTANFHIKSTELHSKNNLLTFGNAKLVDFQNNETGKKVAIFNFWKNNIIGNIISIDLLNTQDNSKISTILSNQ